MKAEINENKKGFEPIEVKITIKSMDELLAIVSQMNTPLSITEKYLPSDLPKIKVEEISLYVWGKIGNKLYKIAKQINK